MKIIDGKNTPLGRLASFAAKELLRGEEVKVVNCNHVIISGNKKNIEKEFEEKRSKMGSSLKGPKHPRISERIVKRSIRGMIPDHRRGRGRDAWKRLKCYNEVPRELEEKEKIFIERPAQKKFINVKHLTKK